MRAKHTALALLLAAIFGCVTLLLSGKRVLVSETKVTPGEHFVVPDHGDLGSNKQASLVCRYFTGRSILTTVFWFSSNNIMGRDQCPFIDSEG